MKKAIEQAEKQEHEFVCGECVKCGASIEKREWVGLTDEEHTQIAIDSGCMSADWVFYGAAVERKVKEKNF